MLRCTRCEGFIPAAVSACPNCTKVAPRGRGFLAVLGAGAAAITLMACYGVPPCTEHATADGGTTKCVESEVDAGVTNDAGVTDGGADAGAKVCDGGTADGGC